MLSILDFSNRVRVLLDLDELPRVWLSNTERDDEANCVVATALGAPVGPSEHPDWSTDFRWVMRLPDRVTAQRVGVVAALEWRADPPEVVLPDEIVDLAISHHFAAVESDDTSALTAWSVIDEGSGQWTRFTPDQPLIEGDRTVLSRAA